MKRLFWTGFALNTLVSLFIWPFSAIYAQGYAAGAFAMLVNLLFLAAGRLWGGLGFLGLAALTYWVTQWLPGAALYLYAWGLSSPVWVALLSLLRFLPIDTRGPVWLDRRHGS